jgi:hypothetical protein
MIGISMIMAPVKKIKRFKKALNVADRKGSLRMIYEFLSYKFSNPGLAEQYFSKFLYRKSTTNPTDYVVTHKIAEKAWYYNDMNYKFIFLKKHIAELYFSQFNIPVVRSFAYNINKMFFVDGELILINNSKEFRDLFIRLKETGKWKEDYMIVKIKEDSYGGRNIFKISSDEVSNGSETVENLYKVVVKAGYLFQNILIQHTEMNRINPNAVNTIRIDSFTGKDGIPRILNTTLRLSRNTSFVDNTTSGGLYAGINMESGELMGEAYSVFDISTGEIFLSHPLTGLVFKGFKIPFYHEAKQLAIKVAKLVPQARIVGWDVGITQEGPVLLEGNFFNDLFTFEIGQKGHRNNPVFRQLLNELDEYYNEQGNDLEKFKEEFPLFV